MNSSHTPGPWHVHNMGLGPNCKGPFTWPLGTDPEEATANARLIAAAPELLEALRYFADELPSIIRQCCPNGVPMSVSAAHDNARAAIDKATKA